MKRYRVLRYIGCGPFTAAFVAVMNWVVGVPANEIRISTIVIEMGDDDW